MQETEHAAIAAITRALSRPQGTSGTRQVDKVTLRIHQVGLLGLT
jgi:hypothetical protein